jgi:hypothetical protein
MIQTLAFNAQLPVLLGASPFYRTPNSPIARGLCLDETDFVKARLTALAIETAHFTRDDIYSLFVTTRIINFLKGLALPATTPLRSLIGAKVAPAPAAVGLLLLKHLLTTGRLYLRTRQGLVENRKFRGDIFQRVLAGMKFIACQNGQAISIDEPGHPGLEHSALEI